MRSILSSVLLLLVLICTNLYAADQATTQDQATQNLTELKLEPLDYDLLDPLLLDAKNVTTGMVCAPALCNSDSDCPCGFCGDDSVCVNPW